MGIMYHYDENIMFNRYTNLDNIEGRILEALVCSKTAHAMRLWNILGNDSMDCLNQENMALVQNPNDEEGWKKEFQRRRNMVYTGVGESSTKKVFFSPFIDDAWDTESSRLDIFVDDVIPTNHITSTVLVGVELIVHNKIVNIFADADEENPNANPSEMFVLYRDEEDNIYTPEEAKRLQEEGKKPEIKLEKEFVPWIRIKSRTATLLKSALAELNGLFVAGVGQLQLNMTLMNNETLKDKVGAKRMIWNNHAYIGHRVVFATIMSGASENPAYGY